MMSENDNPWVTARETLTQRLLVSRKNLIVKRVLYICINYFLVYFIYAVTKARRLLNKITKSSKKESVHGVNVLLTGRFEADGWLRAHIIPLSKSRYVKHVFVVSDKEFAHIENVTYLCPPAVFTKALGRTNARYVWTIYKTLALDVDCVGGFHLLVNGLLAILLASLLGKKSMYFCVGGWSEVIGGGAYSGTKFFGETGIDDVRLERKLLNIISSASLIITMGSRAEKYFIQHVPCVKTIVISGGIDTKIFNTTGVYEKEYDAILVARIDPIKRVDIFLSVIEELSRIILLKAVIVGDGPLRKEMEEFSNKIGISERVDFVGYQGDVAQWLKKARLFILTSDSEGLPLSIMEAMSCGLPVVSSDVGDIQEFVVDGHNGYLVRPRDVSGFTENALKLLENTKLLSEFSKKALTMAEGYSIQATTERWNAVFERADNK
jgi:glycosyltransferase involved in cell wall biosynthesis